LKNFIYASQNSIFWLWNPEATRSRQNSSELQRMEEIETTVPGSQQLWVFFLIAVNTYVVHTFTGDVRGAGTDANVYVTLFGDRGDSGRKVLDNNENNFERSQKDTFNVVCPHLGKLKKIRIGTMMRS